MDHGIVLDDVAGKALHDPDVEPVRRSSIVQLSTSVLGLPGPLDPNEASALATSARRALPRLEVALSPLLARHAAFLGADGTDCVAPTSYVEARWRDRSWRARWGHRVVELHHAASEGLPADAYSRTIRPTLGRWLGIAQEAYDFLGHPPPASAVVFEYVDRIVLGSEVADLSRAFKLNVAVDAAGVPGALTQVTVGARIHRRDRSSRVVVMLDAEPDDLGSVVVHVRTVAERDLGPGLTLASGATLLDAIEEAEAMATEAFHAFVTDPALEVTDDAASSA